MPHSCESALGLHSNGGSVTRFARLALALPAVAACTLSALLLLLYLHYGAVMWYRCEIIRGGMEEYLTPMGPTKLHVHPMFEIGPLQPTYSEWLVFEGISVDETGKQHYLDATVAYKRAVLNAIHYLAKFGYTKEQVCWCAEAV